MAVNSIAKNTQLLQEKEQSKVHKMSSPLVRLGAKPAHDWQQIVLLIKPNVDISMCIQTVPSFPCQKTCEWRNLTRNNVDRLELVKIKQKKGNYFFRAKHNEGCQNVVIGYLFLIFVVESFTKECETWPHNINCSYGSKPKGHE